MRPTRLTLRNIRAFPDLTIDFRHVTACAIIGPNGAGKSTIAEAILRGLYSDGQSVLPASLVRQGSDSAAIEMEFVHDGVDYKVIRLGGKRSDLQLLMSDGNGGWTPLSGATSRETQEKISAILAMDEDLFLHSCCVMQGQSAGICTAKPAERKAVMYRIYDRELGRYTKLHDCAKKHVVDLDNSLAAGRAKRQDLEAKVASKPLEEESKARCEEALQVLGLQLAEAEAELNRLREAAARDEADRERLDDLTRHVSALDAEIASLQARIAEHDRAIRECDELLSQAEFIRGRCAEADRLEGVVAEHQAKREEYSRLGHAFVEATARRDAELSRIGNEGAERLAGLQRIHGQLTAERGQLVTEANGLNAQYDDARRQANLVHEAPCANTTMSEACKLLAEAREARARCEHLGARIKGIELRIAAIAQEIDGNARAIADQRRVNDEALEEARSRLQVEVDEIVRAKDALGYDKTEHQAAIARLESAKGYRAKLAELAAAESRAEEARKSRATAEADLDAKQKQRERLGIEVANLAEQIRNRDVWSDVGLQEASISQIRCDIDAETRNIAAHETRIEQIAEAERELDELTMSLAGAERERALWATLQEAYSRDGIPALIIDAAIPQIEEYANDLLHHLSDGRMRLKFITQKATKTAGIAETLDIIVSDGAGERAYEDFSGGEQLRVNLAVRIAIGQALAQRSGATIRTLLLDEVCAPLDQAGEDALVESICRLQSMFDCILLITHRDSLRDRLPQQIEVIRGANGSAVRMGWEDRLLSTTSKGVETNGVAAGRRSAADSGRRIQPQLREQEREEVSRGTRDV